MSAQNEVVKSLGASFDVVYFVYWWSEDGESERGCGFGFGSIEAAESEVDRLRKKSPDLTYAVVRRESRSVSLRLPLQPT